MPWRNTVRVGTVLAFWVLGLPGCGTLPLVPEPDPASARQVIEQAKALVGTPYRYGGQSPDGFDCSGFVRFVFRQAADVALPRSARQQYSALPSVPLGQERPADLIFFSVDRPGASHVGLYLGQGRFIHAPGRGDKVKLSDANTPYWRQRFVGLRRAL